MCAADQRCECGLPLVYESEFDLGMCYDCQDRAIERTIAREEWSRSHEEPWDGYLYERM